MSRNLNRWLKISNSWEESGLSQEQFCKNKRIKYSQFAKWRSQLIDHGMVARRDNKIDATEAAPMKNTTKAFIPITTAITGQPTSQVNTANNNSQTKSDCIIINLPFNITLAIPADAIR